MHKINHLLDLWEKRFEGLIADGKRSPTSLDTYRRNLKNHVRPAIGELRIGEATTPRLDTVLTKIKTTAGAPTAKTCRAIISGAMKLAVRYGALTVNPVREVDAIEAPTKNPLRALTREEVTLLRKSLVGDQRAVEADIPDLTTFMLGTGVRIGESLAVLWHQIDLEAGTVEITHTIARLTGQGLSIFPSPETADARELQLHRGGLDTIWPLLEPDRPDELLEQWRCERCQPAKAHWSSCRLGRRCRSRSPCRRNRPS
ncbi:site-specific integrase [Kribbella sp. NPDC000426]|uniref:tyrosine-type recombinase/integrase n=1 Tax=Kribbella sp. NPDC000426 TaxID=3154255 RepID=UPI00331BDE69